jgi:signal transduction histidine kinase
MPNALKLILAFVTGSLAMTPAFCTAGRGEATNAAVIAESTPLATELGIGAWIWTTNLEDKQTCRLWHSFTVPGHIPPAQAKLRITADNGYRIFLDGREIGRGGDWKYLTEYDLTWLITPGSHVLAVEAFNDALEAGVILGLRIELISGETIEVLSDPSWRVVPGEERGWQTLKAAPESWPQAKMVGFAGEQPWWQRPRTIIHAPALQPVVLHFWQSTWFLVLLLCACAVAAVVCVRLATQLAVHSRAHRLLERERARIARDIHDDLGAGLTQLTLVGELVLRDLHENGETRNQVDSLCGKARTLLGSMDEIIWTVNPKRDTVSDFAVFICQHAQEFLGSTTIRCRLDLMEDLPAIPMDLPARRNLLLAVKEAVRNAARHSHASELSLQVRLVNQELEVVVADNGRGFNLETTNGDRNGLNNMRQRLADVGGSCHIVSSPGSGCRAVFVLPLATRHGWLGSFSHWRRNHRHQSIDGSP